MTFLVRAKDMGSGGYAAVGDQPCIPGGIPMADPLIVFFSSSSVFCCFYHPNFF
jgi:hypothetical protein